MFLSTGKPPFSHLGLDGPISPVSIQGMNHHHWPRLLIQQWASDPSQANIVQLKYFKTKYEEMEAFSYFGIEGFQNSTEEFMFSGS